MMKYTPIIGLEVHIQLKTKSKLFCSCPVELLAEPNKNICPVCTGQPGVLPVVNKTAVEYAIMAALALNCKINRKSIFARKHYFYPDLPKNYQISQYEKPLAVDGFVEIELKDGTYKKIRIKRINLEEDAAKLFHDIGATELDYSLVDFNRTGIPLIEIVTEPDINSAEESHLYLTTLRNIIRYLGISDCEMEKGSLRCDANISISENGRMGVKTELKNMNSFKAVKEAIEYEINRQIEIKSSGGEVLHETRLWDANKKVTRQMRTKEEMHDYRYFPEPDLPPLVLSEEIIEKLKQNLPELPVQRKRRFQTEYGLSNYDASVLISEKDLADYFEETVKYITFNDKNKKSKLASNWITTELLGRLNVENKSISESTIRPRQMASLILLILNNTISGKIAKTVFDEMYKTGVNPEEIVKQKNLTQITDEKQLLEIIEEVINSYPAIINEYLSGKEKAFSALVGEVMKRTSGKANPILVNQLLKKRIYKK